MRKLLKTTYIDVKARVDPQHREQIFKVRHWVLAYVKRNLHSNKLQVCHVGPSMLC